MQASSLRPIPTQSSTRGLAWVRGLAFSAVGIVLGSCGGGASSPTTPPAPSPTPVPGTHSLTATVFYDFLRNGVLDPEETVRFGDVELGVGGGTGRSQAGTGQAVVQGISAGAHRVVIETSTLPPFFTAGTEVTVDVPQDTEALVPVALPIRQNQPFRYLCTGDSISQGTGSDDEMGYRSILKPMLGNFYGVSIDVKYRGRGGGTSAEGAARTERDLGLVKPAYTLIAWGTNDYIDCGAPASCDTVSNLRSMVLMVKAASSMPCVATIIPPNVGFDDRAPQGRADWVAEMNELIKAMAQQEGALVVDLHAAFMTAGNLSNLFVDHVHPNPRGYELMARTYFQALTRPRNVNPSAAFLRVDAP